LLQTVQKSYLSLNASTTPNSNKVSKVQNKPI
jgi:hypothetical protein